MGLSAGAAPHLAARTWCSPQRWPLGHPAGWPTLQRVCCSTVAAATATGAVKRTRVRPRRGAELAPEPSPLLTEPHPIPISQAAAEIESQVLEDGSCIQWLSRDVRQQAMEEAAQLDLRAQNLQLSTAGQAQQPAPTGVDGASLALASLEPEPKRCSRQSPAEQAAPVLKAAAAPKPARRGRQPAAEQAPAVGAPAGREGVASIVKPARRKPAKPRASPKAGAAAHAQPEAGLLMLQQVPLMEQQVGVHPFWSFYMLKHVSYTSTAAGPALRVLLPAVAPALTPEDLRQSSCMFLIELPTDAHHTDAECAGQHGHGLPETQHTP